MTSGKFKLTRAVGHRGNFADVEVRLVRGSDDRSVSASDSIPEEFQWGVTHAVPGVLQALEEFDPTGATSAVVERLVVILADSTPHNIAAAAYIATARAFGTDAPLEQFIQNDRIVFPGIAD
jgi:hypothetical protein